MKRENLLTIVGTFFLVGLLLHVARLIFGLSFVIGGFELPMWASVVAIIVAAYLSYSSFNLRKK